MNSIRIRTKIAKHLLKDASNREVNAPSWIFPEIHPTCLHNIYVLNEKECHFGRIIPNDEVQIHLILKMKDCSIFGVWINVSIDVYNAAIADALGLTKEYEEIIKKLKSA